MELRWNNTNRAELQYSETCPIVTLTTTNLTRIGLESYLGLRGDTGRLTSTEH
jgi:hypothetical protein